MAFETVSYEQLRQSLAQWTLLNKRGAPLPDDTDAEEYIQGFKIPETDFEFTQSYADQDGDIMVLFKTSVHLSAWQTRNGKEATEFSYYKVSKAILDNDGKILDYETTGYVLISI